MCNDNCKNLVLVNPWFDGPLSSFRACGFELAEGDVITCSRLRKASFTIKMQHVERDESYIPF